MIREIAKAAASYLPLNFLENAANYAALRNAAGLLPAECAAITRETYFKRVCGLLGGSERPILFLEFGVYQGNSIRHWKTLNTAARQSG